MTPVSFSNIRFVINKSDSSVSHLLYPLSSLSVDSELGLGSEVLFIGPL